MKENQEELDKELTDTQLEPETEEVEDSGVGRRRIRNCEFPS